MTARLLLVFYLWFNLNGLLGVEVVSYEGTNITYLLKEELDLSNPIEAIFYNMDGVQRTYDEQVAECKALYPHEGMEVTLMKNAAFLKAAAHSEDIHIDASYRIGLKLEISSWVKNVAQGTWVWEDGSTLAADDAMWNSKHPQNTNRYWNQYYECASWRVDKRSTAEEALETRINGAISSINCNNRVKNCMCQISDIDECATGTYQCAANEVCENTIGGYKCATSSKNQYIAGAAYFNALVQCGLDYPSTAEGCTPHVRTVDSVDNNCYDAAYTTCTQTAYADLESLVGSFYKAMVPCYASSCTLGDVDCHSDSDFTACIMNAFAEPEEIELFENMPVECDLLRNCGGGGHDCVRDYDDCVDYFSQNE